MLTWWLPGCMVNIMLICVLDCEDAASEMYCDIIKPAKCYRQSWYNRCCATCEAYSTRIPGILK